MTQQAIDFVVKTFAITFAALVGLMGLTIFLVALFQGDGEAQRIVADLTTPFLGVLGSLVAAFLGHWFFVLRQATVPGGTPNSAYNPRIAQVTRYDDQQWAANAPQAQSYPADAHGPLVSRLQAQGGIQGQQPQPVQPPAENGVPNGH